jgi:hypothetical protein
VRRRAASETEAPGQDSFLDVVCNLVGILIVLVMVIAAQAKRGMLASETACRDAAGRTVATPDSTEAENAEKAATAVEAGVLEMEAKLKRENVEIALRQQERDRVQILVTVAERSLAEHRHKLSAAEQARYDLESQLARSKSELERLTQIERSLQQPRPEVLEHLPTPMARTVFGTEVHFRLQGGRLAYVPWDEMLERMKADAPNHVSKLRNEPRVELSLPVIRGFAARYILRRADAAMQTRVGIATQGRIELEKMYFVDTEPNLGQPVSQALAANSEFRSRLASLNPKSATVTIWVYPDGFDDFRTLKAELFKLGYLCAARPMPAGKPIGGSPDGTRSAAE